MTREPGTIKTEDGVRLSSGDRAFNYYDHKPGRVGHVDTDGWFDFDHEDGTRALLDGSRICSVEFAAARGWMVK